jgi:hypothetical protein
MLEPLKVGFGEYMTAFYDAILPTTTQLTEFKSRGVAKSIVWAPSQMVDAAEEMLAAWQRNDTDGVDTNPADLPVIVVAVARDYTPTGRDFGRQIADSMEVIIPTDIKERAFGLRTIFGDVRAQVVFFAQNEPTARSLASQFCMFMDAAPNRRFHTTHSFAGTSEQWPEQIESADQPVISIQTCLKNVVIMAADFTLKAQIPLYDAPAEGEYNDGKGTPGTDDPAGYPLVVQVDAYPHDTP